MLHRLQEGKQSMIFLDNMLRDGTLGEKIEKINQIYLQTKSGSGYICDDPQLPIFPELKKLRYEQNVPISITPRYYSYCLIAGNYKLLVFGHTINEKLKEVDTTDRFFNSVTERGQHGFLNYDKSYFDEEKVDTLKFTNGFDSLEDLHKTKTRYIEDIRNDMRWTNDKNYDLLINFFKENNIESDIIKKITQKQRELKLNRILQQDKVEITVDTLLEIKSILDESNIINEEINELCDGRI